MRSSVPSFTPPTEDALLASVLHYSLAYFNETLDPSAVLYVIREAFRSADDNYGAEEAAA